MREKLKYAPSFQTTSFIFGRAGRDYGCSTADREKAQAILWRGSARRRAVVIPGNHPRGSVRRTAPLGGASRTIADMPRRWRDCIEGKAKSTCSPPVLRPAFQLWSCAGLGAGMKSLSRQQGDCRLSTEPAGRKNFRNIWPWPRTVTICPIFVIDGASLMKRWLRRINRRICASDRTAEFDQRAERRQCSSSMGTR